MQPASQTVMIGQSSADIATTRQPLFHPLSSYTEMVLFTSRSQSDRMAAKPQQAEDQGLW